MQQEFLSSYKVLPTSKDAQRSPDVDPPEPIIHVHLSVNIFQKLSILPTVLVQILEILFRGLNFPESGEYVHIYICTHTHTIRTYLYMHTHTPPHNLVYLVVAYVLVRHPETLVWRGYSIPSLEGLLYSMLLMHAFETP